MNRSAIAAIVSPALVVCFYLALWWEARGEAPSTSGQFTPEQSVQLWQGSDALFAAGKYREALPPLLQLCSAYPGNHIYLERAAEIYDHLGRYTDEATYWEKYFDRAPNPITACPQIGDAYRKAGRQTEAVRALQRCMALDSENSDSIFFLAHALERTGQLDQAAVLYRRGLKLSPTYSDLQIGLARVLIRQGKLVAAEAEITAVLRRVPRNIDALLVAGLVSERQGRLTEAKQYLRSGVALSDGYLDFHVALAGIAEEEQDFAEALRQYDRILRERPDDQDVRARRDALMETP